MIFLLEELSGQFWAGPRQLSHVLRNSYVIEWPSSHPRSSNLSSWRNAQGGFTEVVSNFTLVGFHIPKEWKVQYLIFFSSISDLYLIHRFILCKYLLSKYWKILCQWAYFIFDFDSTCGLYNRLIKSIYEPLLIN